MPLVQDGPFHPRAQFLCCLIEAVDAPRAVRRFFARSLLTAGNCFPEKVVITPPHEVHRLPAFVADLVLVAADSLPPPASESCLPAHAGTMS